MWNRVEPFGIVWIVEPSGAMRSHVEPCGTVWNGVEPYRTVWSRVEPCGTVWSISFFMLSDLETREYLAGIPRWM